MNNRFFQKMIAPVFHRGQLSLLNKLPDSDGCNTKNLGCAIGCDEFHQAGFHRAERSLPGQTLLSRYSYVTLRRTVLSLCGTIHAASIVIPHLRQFHAAFRDAIDDAVVLINPP